MSTFNETPVELSKCDNNIPLFSFANEIHLAKVVKCYDSTTFYCIFKHNEKYQKFHIRMRQYNNVEKVNEAKQKLEEYILNKNVYLYLKDFDKYGRIFAELKLTENDDKTINQLMIDGGYNYEYNENMRQEKISTNLNKKYVNNKPKKKQKIKIDTSVDFKDLKI